MSAPAYTPRFTVTALGFVDETGALALALGNPNRRRNERILLAAPELVEALRDEHAILETLLAHYWNQMPEADRVQRERVMGRARALLARIEGKEGAK